MESLFAKSDLRDEQKKTIMDSLEKAMEIKKGLNAIVEDTNLLHQKREMAKDAIDNINDTIILLTVIAARTDMKLSYNITTGRYVIMKIDTNIEGEIDCLLNS